MLQVLLIMLHLLVMLNLLPSGLLLLFSKHLFGRLFVSTNWITFLFDPFCMFFSHNLCIIRLVRILKVLLDRYMLKAFDSEHLLHRGPRNWLPAILGSLLFEDIAAATHDTFIRQGLHMVQQVFAFDAALPDRRVIKEIDPVNSQPIAHHTTWEIMTIHLLWRHEVFHANLTTLKITWASIRVESSATGPLSHWLRLWDPGEVIIARQRLLILHRYRTLWAWASETIHSVGTWPRRFWCFTSHFL